MDIALWKDFFVATAGASAALVGLIIVAMSVNIETIVRFRSLPSRAGTTIANLTIVVVLSIVGLVPSISSAAFGIIVLIFGLVALAMGIESTVQIVRNHRENPQAGVVGKSVVAVTPGALVVVSCVLLLAGLDVGLYGIAAAVVLAFVGSVLNAWILLVEIRR